MKSAIFWMTLEIARATGVSTGSRFSPNATAESSTTAQSFFITFAKLPAVRSASPCASFVPSRIIVNRAITFSCSLAAFVPPAMPIFMSCALRLVSVMITPKRRTFSWLPISAPISRFAASSSSILLKDARSTASAVSVLLSAAALPRSKPSGTNVSCADAMKSAICRFDRPTSPAKLSPHFFAPSASSPKTARNLPIVSSMSDAALTAGMNIAPAATPIAPIDAPIVPTLFPKDWRRLSTCPSPRINFESSRNASTKALPMRTAPADAMLRTPFQTV